MLVTSLLATQMSNSSAMSPTMVEKYFSQFLPKRPTQTIFDLGPKERFKMIREVHNAHQKSWKKNSKKLAKRNRSKRNSCSLAPSSRHYLPAYPKQEVSQSIYNIIVPCIVFSCYFIPKIIQEMFYSLRRDSTVCFTERLLEKHFKGVCCSAVYD